MDTHSCLKESELENVILWRKWMDSYPHPNKCKLHMLISRCKGMDTHPFLKKGKFEKVILWSEEINTFPHPMKDNLEKVILWCKEINTHHLTKKGINGIDTHLFLNKGNLKKVIL